MNTQTAATGGALAEARRLIAEGTALTTKALAPLRERLAAEMIHEAPKSVSLVYVDYRDELSDEQVAAIVAGDRDTLWDSLADWEGESTAHGLRYALDELADDVLRKWSDVDDDLLDALRASFRHSDEEESVADVLREREDGAWFRQMARQTGDVLLRVGIPTMDEDAGLSYRKTTPKRTLKLAGLPATAENLSTIGDVLANHEPEMNVTLGYWIVGVNVAELLDLPDDGKVTITDPHLYLGNPFAGSGYISDEPMRGTVTVAREDLRTDKAQFGYSVSDIYGGLRPSSFSAQVAAVTA